VSNAPSKPVSFSRPKVGYFSNRPRISICAVIHFLTKINALLIEIHYQLGEG